MAGMVLGRYFKQVVTPLLHAGTGSKQLEARLETLDDEGEYEWEEFAAALSAASARVSHRDLVAIGKRIITAAKPEFERWGFDSAEAILTDLDAPFGASIIDPPEHQRLLTAKYEPGYAVFRVGVGHPAALVEGYLRGIVEAHGGTVNELSCHYVRMDDQPFHLLELRWRTPARVTARRRPASGPRMVA
jgi:hypothetical protein